MCGGGGGEGFSNSDVARYQKVELGNQVQNFDMGEGVSKTAKKFRRLLWTAPAIQFKAEAPLNQGG